MYVLSFLLPAIFGWLSSAPDAVHYHQELDIGLGFTKGYEIWVFDSGTFSLAGDGGYVNWAIGGCFSGPKTDVVFTKCWWRQLKYENMNKYAVAAIRKTGHYLISILPSFSKILDAPQYFMMLYITNTCYFWWLHFSILDIIYIYQKCIYI